jgi:hypothetical protein
MTALTTGATNAAQQQITKEINTILQQSQVALKMGSKSIDNTVNLNLPRAVPLPPSITFPYSIKLGIYAMNEEAIEISTLPLTITTNQQGINVQTGVSIIPQNTDQAANALAAAMNPLLSSNPKVSPRHF